MSPTLHNGDKVIVRKFDHKASRGDVIVFKSVSSPGVNVVKRLIGKGIIVVTHKMHNSSHIHF